ncbi:hypothetical protein CS542_00665 [Pedobacter sp. IW39]|nr:hypothetical protein CS542_00665 [Pedobacter sp. IW39]
MLNGRNGQRNAGTIQFARIQSENEKTSATSNYTGIERTKMISSPEFKARMKMMSGDNLTRVVLLNE